MTEEERETPEKEIDPIVKERRELLAYRLYMDGMTIEQIRVKTGRLKADVIADVKRQKVMSRRRAALNRNKERLAERVEEIMKKAAIRHKKASADDSKNEALAIELRAAEFSAKLNGFNSPKRSETKSVTMRIDPQSLVNNKEKANGELEEWQDQIKRRRIANPPGLPPPASTPPTLSTTAASSTTLRTTETEQG